MTRIAIIADIHSNLAALEAIFEDMEKESVDQIICLGDVIGYGPQPRECLDLLLTRVSPEHILLGNHEAALIGKTFYYNGKNLTVESYFHQAARQAIYWTLSQLQPPGQPPLVFPLLSAPQETPTLSPVVLDPKYQFLLNLKTQIVDDDILYVHAMVDEEEFLRTVLYINEADDYKNALHSFAYMRKQGFKLNFHGHHHVPGLWYIQNKKVRYNKFVELEGYEKESELTLTIPRTRETLINAGSVGQPRDGDLRASYGILTRYPDHYEYKAKRITYDAQKTSSLIREIEPLDNRFAERLIYKNNLTEEH